jgi:hypothetical protein
MTFRNILFLAPLLLAASCGTNTSTDGDALPPDPYADPPDYSGDPFQGFGPVTSISLPAPGGTEMPGEAAGGPWSVQIAACGTLQAAEALRERVGAVTAEAVFIDLSGAYYKVRVGSFPTAEDSADLRNLLRSSGYPDAWSVERAATP